MLQSTFGYPIIPSNFMVLKKFFHISPILILLSLTVACLPFGLGGSRGEEKFGAVNDLGGNGNRVGPQGDAEGFLGVVATFENAHPRCSVRFEREQASNIVRCVTVVMDEKGNEWVAAQAADGVKFSWSDPVVVKGSPGTTQISCETGAQNLTQDCEISVQTPDLTEVQFGLGTLDPITGEKREHTTTVALITARTYGFVTELLGFQPPTAAEGSSEAGPQTAGQQTIGFDPTSHPIGAPYSVCASNGRLYVGTAEYIFLIENGKMSLYAGNPNRKNHFEYSHRLRVSFTSLIEEPGKAMGLLCTPNALFVADMTHRILKLTDSGPVVPIAGNGKTGDPERDGKKALEMIISRPLYLVEGPEGALYFYERGWRHSLLRRIDPVTSIVTSVPVPPNVLTEVRGLAYRDGAFYVSNTSKNSIYRITPDGTATRIAGTGESGLSGDGGPAIHAQFNVPSGLAFDSAGNLYVADYYNRRIRVLKPAPELEGGWRIETFAGTSFGASSVLRMQACTRYAQKVVPIASSRFCGPRGLGFDAAGNLYVADTLGSLIWKLDTTGMSTLFAGANSEVFEPKLIENSMGTSLSPAQGISYDSSGGLIMTETRYNRVRLLDLPTGELRYLAGTRPPEGAIKLPYVEMRAAKYHPDGSLMILTQGGILRIDKDGTISTFAGKPKGRRADDIPATEFGFGLTSGLAIHPNGTVYVAEHPRNIFAIDPATGIIRRLAGALNGSCGFSGEPILAREGSLCGPSGLAVGVDNALYVADYDNNSIRRIDLTTNIMTTIAGKKRRAADGDGKDDAWGDETSFYGPRDVAVTSQGQVYVADTLGGRVRVLTPEKQPDGTSRYRVTNLIGGGGSWSKDCSGNIISELGKAPAEKEMAASLSELCHAVPIAIATKDNCKAGGQGEVKIAVANSYSSNFTHYFPSGSIVELTRPCR